jgi:fructose-1,6-bisphosphatase I
LEVIVELSHYLFEQTSEDKRQAASIILDIAIVAKQISHEVQRSGLLNLHGRVGVENVQGEEVQILDERCNNYMKEQLAANEHVVVLASEEDEYVVVAGKGNGFAVAFDPLDGSSNIDVNASIGTIFSVLPAEQPNEAAFLQPGKNQVAAGYVLYGSSTVLVFTFGDNRVLEFTLDPDRGDFLQTSANIKIPKSGGYISFNAAMLSQMKPDDEMRFRTMLYEDGRSSRYIGAMVADVHRTLLKGGLFAYPEVKTSDQYRGKLRLQYEVKPLGWLFTQAGGVAFIGDVPCNEYQPTALHERVGVVFGE